MDLLDNQNNMFIKYTLKNLHIIQDNYKDIKNKSYFTSKGNLNEIIKQINFNTGSFNADLKQVSLHLTRGFIGFSYYFYMIYIWFLNRAHKLLQHQEKRN